MSRNKKSLTSTIGPIMPKATAVWLIQNSKLTFDQIADFCSIHRLEVQGIADGEVARGISGIDPVDLGQLTRVEIVRCENDPQARLRLSQEMTEVMMREQEKRSKTRKYTPIAKRQDKPDAVAWLVKYCSELSDSQIAKLISSTKKTVSSVRDRSHWNIINIKPKDPVLLGFCSQTDLNLIYHEVKEKVAIANSTDDSEIITKAIESWDK